MEQEQLESFIIANHRFLTIRDMADECSVKYAHIQHLCYRLGVVPLSCGERNRNFVKEYYERKPKKWIAQALSMTEKSVSQIYYKLKIEEPIFPEEEKPISVREIFSSYRVRTPDFDLMNEIGESLKRELYR